MRTVAVVSAMMLTAATHPALAQPSAEPLEVTVSGEQPLLPSASSEPTAATTVVTEDRLRVPGKSSADVLEEVAGVQVARTGGGADLATAGIRGATSAQTPVYVGDIRINDDITGTADLSHVPTWMLQRAEIYRGHSPALSSRLGLGGEIRFYPTLPKGNHFGGGYEIGSFGHQAAHAGTSFGDGKSGVSFGLRTDTQQNDYAFTDDRGTRFDESDDVERTRPNADANTTDVWAISRARISRSASMSAILNSFSREQGVTGLGIVPATRARAQVRRNLSAIRSRLACGDRCTSSVGISSLSSSLTLIDPSRELAIESARVRSEGRRLALDGSVGVQVTDAVRVGGAFEQSLDLLTRRALGTAPNRARRSHTQLGADIAIAPTTHWVIYGLAAGTLDATRGLSQDAEAPNLSGRLGTRVAATQWLSLFANVGRYVRVPTLGELYGVAPAVQGSAALNEERGYSADVGARATAEHANVRAAVEAVAFSRWVSDLIGYRQSSLGVVRPFNEASARFLGGELTAAIDAYQTIRADLALSALDPRRTSEGATGNDQLPYLARLTVAPALTVYRAPAITAISLSRASLRAQLFYRASRVADPAGLIVLPERLSFDIEAALHFLDDRLRLLGRAANLTDDRSTDIIGFPLPGRSFAFAGELWW